MSRPYAIGLSTHALKLSRGGSVIVDNVTLDFTPGSITMLRGANGAGKTTLLRTLAGLLAPASGDVRLTGALEENGPSEQRRQAVFFGHQDSIKDALSIRDNLRFWAALYGAGPEIIEKALANLDIVALQDRRADTLSAGQRRRTGFCRVLIAQKPLWLLDEPTASMDAKSIARLCEMITAHRANGGCILIATHDPLEFDGALTLELHRKDKAA